MSLRVASVTAVLNKLNKEIDMKKDSFAIISRFHVSSMSLVLFLILSMGMRTLYSMLGNSISTDTEVWMMITWTVCIIWLLFFIKDWIAYYKLYRDYNYLIQDERFRYHSYKAAKLGFIALVTSNFSILIVDLSFYSLSAAFASVFSLVFGVSVYLLAHITLELQE